MESQDNIGVHSSSSPFDSGKDYGRLYANSLLESILERNNLNTAYKRVKSNKRSAGTDGMKNG